MLDWGVEVVLWFQQFSPALDLPFKSLTFLGNLEFFLILMPLIYWCLDRRMGARLLILFLISAYINSVAKVIADQPRPFHYDSRIKALVHAGGGGLPSGHTQSAVVVWGYLASQARRPVDSCGLFDDRNSNFASLFRCTLSHRSSRRLYFRYLIAGVISSIRPNSGSMADPKRASPANWTGSCITDPVHLR